MQNLKELPTEKVLTSNYFTAIPQEKLTPQITHLKVKRDITSDNLKKLIEQHPHLESINLRGCHQITDVSFLADLSQLQWLDLSECNQITDVSFLADLTQLQVIKLSGCNQITDLSFLANLTQLQIIKLSACNQITDLAFLANLTQLQLLDLRKCNQIIDFSFLLECENLKYLAPPEGTKYLIGSQLSGWLTQACLREILNQAENDDLREALNHLLNILHSNETIQLPESRKNEVLINTYYFVKRSIETNNPQMLDEALQVYQQTMNTILGNLNLDKGLKEKLAGFMLASLGVTSLIFAVAVIGSFCLVACPALLAAAPAAIVAIASTITSTGTALLATEGLLVAGASSGVIGVASIATSCMFFQKAAKKSKVVNNFRENFTEQTENFMNAINQP